MPQIAAIRLFAPSETATKTERLLLALARYQYLTSRQARALLGGRYDDLMGRVFPALLAAGLIHCRKYGAIPERGRLDYVWYLTPAGVERAADMLGMPADSIYYHHDQKHPPGKAHYDHREHTIDIAIALDTWAIRQGVSVPLLETSENRGHRAAGTRAKVAYRVTTIPMAGGGIAKPDIIFSAVLRDKPALFLLELHEGTHMQHIADQLRNHMALLSEHGVQERYGNTYSHTLLSVHTHASTLALAKARMQALPDFPGFHQSFLFNTLENVRADFGAGWHRADGTPSRVFLFDAPSY